ncbi:arrestin domain-containing protein 3-like [Betta splendens]|uniref:Arrestin domain-containing protein 3-like n=1 Tax=Betta splendens TaxID=158456 RepID=A0A6P7NN46_BETSP|nr:arrestin domain-containing protein 3-like [Betta splendens]
MSVQSLTLTYDALNEHGTFCGGDTITGSVTLTVEKDITVQTLFLKFKGDANVHWTERRGDHSYSYAAHRRYFKLKQALIPESAKDTPVPKGVHAYKFRFDIPGNVPPSIKANHGKIVYKLEAVLSRSWRLNRTVGKEIVFVSKSFPDFHSLMSQQMGSTDKEMGPFSKGHTHMDVFVDRRAYFPGEKIMILAKVNNSSSRDMTPKFSLNQDVVYRDNCKAKCEELVIAKATGECIKPQTQVEARCEITIPPNQMQTVPNCDILSLDYFLKVYLDISFATDPEVKLPVIILPYSFPRGPHPGLPTGPYPPGGFGAPANSDFPAPGAFAGPYPAFSGPNHSNYPPPGAFGGPYPAGGFGAPANSDFPAPGAFAGPYPAVGAGGPSNGHFPPPGAFPAPCPAGGFGGPVNSGFPPPGVSGGHTYPPTPNSGYYGYPGAPSCPAPPAASPNNPPAYAGLPAVSPSQPADMKGSQSNPAPVFAPPSVEPPSYSSLLNTSSPPPAYNLLPSAPMMSMDFLSQTDEAPAAFSVPPLPSDAKKTDNKE